MSLHRLPIVVLFTLLPLVAACGGASVDSVCGQACACDTSLCGTQETTCVTDGDVILTQATKAGCVTQFDDFLTCLGTGTNACNKDGTTCATERAAATKCGVQGL